ncbi:DNA-directed RNA polymerases IV and V subunit 2 [Vitis vinifera]|uniref:DNA-directed RNA polymerase n=1 Tax=Vitis vinifera TaxID=29760 RepID=A0A438IF30_VITVI|nr:DNA-directed RNA polymerases IV and V subunit 2 [Vitis vinifera]
MCRSVSVVVLVGQVYTQKLVRSDKYKTGKDNKYVEKKVIFEDNRDILIGRIPVMVKSELCWMNGVERGDCEFDHGGYFLIKGAEKVRLQFYMISLYCGMLSSLRTLPSFYFIMMVEQLNEMNLSGQRGLFMWYAKRFLHPDIVAPYDYIFIWDEDLGVEHFNAEEETEEKPGWCPNPHLPPCAAFVEIMAPNDLVHGWGLDFALRRCVELAHEKIGVVDSQWIVHQTVPSLGNQVRERCKKEWTMFRVRMTNAEKTYYKEMGINPTNSTTD